MGLGTVQQNNTTFLSLAGGYVWNRKADESNPNFATQDYETSEGKKTRQGARYADLSGSIKGVEFKTHDKFGESINVTFDASGESYTIAIATNNRYSQDMMKALLKLDLTKEVYLKPYDFVDKDGRRAQGVVFRQDGEKINLRNDDAPSKESEWFKSSNKKQIKRFFEDLTEWFIAEVEEKVIPQLGNDTPQSGLGTVEQEERAEDTTFPSSMEDVTDEKPPVEKSVSPLKMKKALKVYMAENYEGEALPKLSKEDLKKWYDLAQAEEELPIDDSAEVAEGDLDAQLGALLDS
jgi:hypothetical protein